MKERKPTNLKDFLFDESRISTKCCVLPSIHPSIRAISVKTDSYQSQFGKWHSQTRRVWWPCNILLMYLSLGFFGSTTFTSFFRQFFVTFVTFTSFYFLLGSAFQITQFFISIWERHFPLVKNVQNSR